MAVQKIRHDAIDVHPYIIEPEMRMADEIDRKPSAQGRRSDFVRSSDEVTPTIEELGLSRQRVAEWRETRDAGELEDGARTLRATWVAEHEPEPESVARQILRGARRVGSLCLSASPYVLAVVWAGIGLELLSSGPSVAIQAFGGALLLLLMLFVLCQIGEEPGVRTTYTDRAREFAAGDAPAGDQLGQPLHLGIGQRPGLRLDALDQDCDHAQETVRGEPAERAGIPDLP